MISPELQSQIAGWRQGAADGTMTLDEMREAVKLLREGRLSSSYSADAAKRKKAIAAIPKADDLLSEMEDM